MWLHAALVHAHAHVQHVVEMYSVTFKTLKLTLTLTLSLTLTVSLCLKRHAIHFHHVLRMHMSKDQSSVCNSIWSHLSTTSTNFTIHVQWIPSHIGLPGNTLADSEAKQGSTLSQSSVPIDLASAKVQIRRTGQHEFHTRYLADPHSATHCTLTREVSPQFHWRLGWYQCITVAQLRTGHSPLLASYLHRIGRQQSPLCPHCGGDDETAQHLLLCCPTHMQARTSTNYTDSTNPRRMMSFLETIEAVTRPPNRE